MNSKPWSDFPPIPPSQWKEVAQQELNGDDPFQKLRVVKGKISVLPYYGQPATNHSSIFSLPVATNSFWGARAWVNTPIIRASNELVANSTALKHLNGGAEGVFFEIASPQNVSVLLKNIELPFCHVFFGGKIDAPFCREVEEYVKINFPGSNIHGAYLTTVDITASSTAFGRSFKGIGFSLVDKASAEETIAEGLKTLVMQLDRLNEHTTPLADLLNQVAFSVSIGTDFFHDIARLKTLRTLYKLVAKAYGVENAAPHIHGMSGRWINGAFQPHGNLIKSTTAGIAGVLGGCDSLTIEPEGDIEMSERIARNVSLLLREESHLSLVADPLEGSYYLETLCTELAEKSWELFQEMMKR